MVKFNIEGQVVEVEDDIVRMSTLLSTTCDTNLRVDCDINGNPIVEIIIGNDVKVLTNYYTTGEISDDILDAFDRLLFNGPITKDRLKLYWLDKICPISIRDKKIITRYTSTTDKITNISTTSLEDIWKPLRRFQHYGILLNGINKPSTYTLIPIDKDGPRGKVNIMYSQPSTSEKYIVLDDICYNAYETLKKYKKEFTYLLIISDHPTLYSIDEYIRNHVIPLRKL